MLTANKQNEIIGKFSEKHISLYMKFFEVRQKKELEDKKQILANVLSRTDIIHDLDNHELKDADRKHFEDNRYSFAVSAFNYAKQKMSVIEFIDIQIKHNQENIDLLIKNSLFEEELKKLKAEKEVLLRQGVNQSLMQRHEAAILLFSKRIEEQKNIAFMWTEFDNEIRSLKKELQSQ